MTLPRSRPALGLRLELSIAEYGRGFLGLFGVESTSLGLVSPAGTEAELSWLSAVLGVGYRRPLGPVVGTALWNAELTRLRLAAQGQDTNGASSRWLPGTSLAAELAFPVRRGSWTVAPVLRSALELSPPTDLRVADDALTRLSPVAFSLQLGLRLQTR